MVALDATINLDCILRLELKSLEGEPVPHAVRRVIVGLESE